jgi:acyl dehydratase
MLPTSRPRSPLTRRDGKERFMTGRTISELHEGDHAQLTRVVDPADIESFTTAVGDANPLHSDPAFAATTTFKTPIAPGIFTAGMISAVIGTRLPGPGSIYVSQELKFLKPVRAGDTITARVEVKELVRDRNRVRLKTVCTNQRGEEVLIGDAWVLPARQPVGFDERRAAVRSQVGHHLRRGRGGRLRANTPADPATRPA